MYGSDAKFASEPEDFKIYCKSIKQANSILSSKVNKNNLKPFISMRKIFQKSIIYAQNLNKNEKIKLNNKINQLEIKNFLLTENLDLDYIEILIREKFLFGRENEKIYIIKGNED